ncbi:MAG: hypothetical protein HJJLKODD_01762 [Phycisphaerae bacterium]|nr:hypothetical protein [Phycisphaerae bacterium]
MSDVYGNDRPEVQIICGEYIVDFIRHKSDPDRTESRMDKTARESIGPATATSEWNMGESALPAWKPRRTLGSLLRGLQFKWTVLVTVLMFILALTAEYFIRQKIEAMVINQEVQQLKKQTDLLAAQASEYLLQDNRLKLEELSHICQQNSTTLYVQFFDAHSNTLSSWESKLVHPTPLQESSSRDPLSMIIHEARLSGQTADHPPYLDVVRPAMRVTTDTGGQQQEQLCGYVRLGVNLTTVQNDLIMFLQNIRYAGLSIVLAMIPLVFIVVRRVVSPINELSQVVNQMARGDYRVRCHIQRSDEIGQLADSFNHMADVLTKTHDDLVKNKVELEDRVLQRTRQLKELASRDPLTGLYNRRHLGELLVRRFSESERYNSDLSCLMIDLDNFKKVNDKYGHEVGDSLLMLTATVIGSELRGADMGARFGGDEFCILLPSTSAEQAYLVGQRIVDRFQQEVKTQLKGKDIDFGISIGAAGLREIKAVHPDELMKAADQALYLAKQAGKNRIHLAECVT